MARHVALVPAGDPAPFDFTVPNIVDGRFLIRCVRQLEGRPTAHARQAIDVDRARRIRGRSFSTLSGAKSSVSSSRARCASHEPSPPSTSRPRRLDIGHKLEVQILLQPADRESRVTMVMSTHDMTATTRCASDRPCFGMAASWRRGTDRRGTWTPETVKALLRRRGRCAVSLTHRSHDLSRPSSACHDG